MTLSKSNYLTYLKHPAWLWLLKHRPEVIPEPDENLQAIFAGGNLFEEYAEQRFPDALRLGFKDGQGHMNYQKYQALPEVTREALSGEHTVILQGRMEIDGLTCIFDVLERNAMGTFNLYEIKSSTEAKKEHEHDLAFQTIVLERTGLTIENIYVIHVNAEYVRGKNIDPIELSTVTEVTGAVRALIPATEASIAQAQAVLASETMPDPSPRHARNGAFTEWLDIYEAIQGTLPQYSIYHLHKVGARRAGQLEDLGISTIDQIPDTVSLTTKQQEQREVTLSGERYVDQEKIQTFLSSLQYPLYFLDYETFADVIPPFPGLRPYQQVPFQYSLHIVDEPGAPVRHEEYLHEAATNPVPELLQKLRQDIGDTGTVLVWYKSFEMSRNAEMAALAPEYSTFLYGVNDRVVDLMTPFAEGWFADRDFLGSSSIKAVLPVLVPTLTYKGLNIQGGSTAQRVWTEVVLHGHQPELKAQHLQDLRDYCTLDTLAMVKIWEVLKAETK